MRSHLLPAPRTSRDLFSHRDVARVLSHSRCPSTATFTRPSEIHRDVVGGQWTHLTTRSGQSSRFSSSPPPIKSNSHGSHTPHCLSQTPSFARRYQSTTPGYATQASMASRRRRKRLLILLGLLALLTLLTVRSLAFLHPKHPRLTLFSLCRLRLCRPRSYSRGATALRETTRRRSRP